MTSQQQISRFTFTLRTPDGSVIESQIQGSGGQIGDGCDYIFSTRQDSDKIAKVLRGLLKQARRYAEKNELRLWCDHDDYRLRMTDGNDHQILSIRAKRGPLIIMEMSVEGIITHEHPGL